MLNFILYLEEHFLNIGLNPKHEKYREHHRNDIHDILHSSYKTVDGGYSGKGSGSKEESDAIHNDITNSLIKATKKDGKITAVSLYKNQHGRKLIALGTNGTEEGKKDIRKISHEDNSHKRAWGEYSGAAEKMTRKIGMPQIPSSEAEKLIGKKVTLLNKDRYKRKIGHEEHEKTLLGHIKSS